jgi:hypothetical protein
VAEKLKTMPAKEWGVIRHSVSWNGHHLIGTFVAIVITGLIALKMVTVHPPAPCQDSLFDSLTRMTCTAAAPARILDTRTASSVTGTAVLTVTAPGPATATRFASSCERLQEAIQSGSEADIVAGMNAVSADETVDATSRKVAGHYTGRDRADESRQKRNLLILQDSCMS